MFLGSRRLMLSICAWAMAVSSSITVPASAAAWASDSPASTNIFWMWVRYLVRVLSTSRRFSVVVAVRQAQAALIDLRDHLRGVVVILLSGETEERRVGLVVACCHAPGNRWCRRAISSVISFLDFRAAMRPSSGCSGFSPAASMPLSSMQAAQ